MLTKLTLSLIAAWLLRSKIHLLDVKKIRYVPNFEFRPTVNNINTCIIVLLFSSQNYMGKEEACIFI